MIQEKLDVPFDPIAVSKRLCGQPGLAFLYSGLQAYGLGRYSILAANPLRTLSSRCFEAIERELAGHAGGEGGGLPFYGGPIGYLSYDAGRSLEATQLKPSSGEVPGVRFAVYDGALVFDHEKRETWLTGLGVEEGRSSEALRFAAAGEGGPELEAFSLQEALQSNFERSEYLEAVESVRSRIRCGDVYQVNLSQRFEAKCAGSAFDLFLRLAEKSPAPYSAYLDFGDEQIVSSSPERFLQIGQGRATTRPIKGTRSAGVSEEEAEANARELGRSEKDRSELLMIVDLERNDLGRVCEPGSVRVDELFRLERYATVIHQTADVSGVLESGVQPIDCVKALFPGGSITGAPKIRAMQVIDELERGERGIYTGAIGYFDVSGKVDLNIAIRTLRIAGGRLCFQVGGGIVWDSDPASEYEETLLKAKAMVSALGGSLHG
ncbi:aminodeoxychorismate synthase component I [Pelagicoccus sp. SDUM812005]|uniref:aminodeoxychorismate synthase component I n=1 Tax=Pelagicoccus sp. SDUM812005 TaxID=3041257 RepID=UPI00280EE522|nr:aminodeoxychorismate synthase component I [Pelagicoccus sp. SDUM812005]MDQ8180965.1 aminodeoxychorismate synthase component I [Pelagicoccus sp. SDUM812005]